MTDETGIFDEEIDPHSLFSVVMIDKRRKKKVHVVVEDEDGEEVEIQELIGNITAWLKDQMNEEEPTATNQQVMPLMAQSLVAGALKLLGQGPATVLLANGFLRYSMTYMMGVGFLTLKFIQQNNLKITSYEEDLEEEDIEMYQRLDKASNFASMAGVMGVNPRTALREMLKNGLITEDDLDKMGAADILDDESDDESQSN